MKKLLTIAAIIAACAASAVPQASAQTASFVYTGVPTGPIAQGSSFTIGINVVFTSGGNVINLNGLSFWMSQSAGTGFPFSISSRDNTGSLFTDLQTTNFNLALPNPIDPINRHSDGTTNNTDLGALSGPPQGNGTYFITNLTFTATGGSGTYTIRNTTSTTPNVGGRISVVNDSNGTTAFIAASPFNVTIVPEPSTFALLGFGLVSAGVAAYRRRR